MTNDGFRSADCRGSARLVSCLSSGIASAAAGTASASAVAAALVHRLDASSQCQIGSRYARYI